MPGGRGGRGGGGGGGRVENCDERKEAEALKGKSSSEVTVG